MTVDLYIGLGVVQQRGGELVKRSLGIVTQLGAVEAKEDTIVEGHLDALKTVNVGNGVDLSASDLSQLTSLLVHLLANERTSYTTSNSANSTTDGSTLALADERTDTSADSSTAATADETALRGIVHGTTARDTEHQHSTQ